MNRSKQWLWWVILACTMILSSCNKDESESTDDFNKQTILCLLYTSDAADDIALV